MKAVHFAGLFVSGTDTGVGKTVVTAGVAAVLRDEGLDLGVWKPVQSGALADDVESDAYRLKAWTGVVDRRDEIAPLVFPAPLTPLLAAEKAGHTLTMEQVMAGGRLLMDRHQALLVEGAGGLAVPLTQEEMMLHLAIRLELPILLVARAGLGTINHTLLSVWYAREHGVPVAGVIVNESLPDGTKDESIRSNAAMIERYGDVPVWGHIPYMPEPVTRQHAAEIFRKHVDLESIRSSIQNQLDKKEALQ
jgi:dethiobiotin synthetase